MSQPRFKRQHLQSAVTRTMAPRLMTGNEGLSSENNLLEQRGMASQLNNHKFFT